MAFLDRLHRVFGLEDHEHNHILSFTLLVLGFFVFTSILSILLFPGYSISGDFLSTLGTGKARYPFIFNYSVIITAILLIPTYWAINGILLRNVPSGNDRYLKFSFGAAIVSSIALAGVGLLPAENSTYIPHAISALIFFLAIGIYYVVITFLVIRILKICHNFREFLSPADYLGFAFIVLVLVLIDINTWYSKLLQKFIVYSSLLFLVYLASKVKRIDHLNQVIHERHHQ